MGINELSLNNNERLQYSIDHNADRASPRVLPKDTSAEQIFAVMGTEQNQVMSEKDRFDWKWIFGSKTPTLIYTPPKKVISLVHF